MVKLLEQLEQLGELVGARSGPSLLVLQPTPYCNLDCSYCYLQHRDSRRRMSDDTLSAIARNILAACPPDNLPVVVWHGGEPMTLSPGWYANAFDLLQRESGQHGLRHAFQSNAIGVNDAWISLWRKWRVNLGISLDGPRHLHDQRRLTRGGRGSHALVMRGLARLKAAHLPFHVISVLSAESLARADDLYDFYTSHNLRNVGFNVEEDEGQAGGSSLSDLTDIAIAYAGFLDRFLERCAEDPEPFYCREVEGVTGLLRHPHETRAQNAQVVPFDILSVGADGSLSTFSPELLGVAASDYDNFTFGNVRDGGVQMMQENDAFRRAHAHIADGVRACAWTCAYFEVCGGGAPANKFFELGDLQGTETLHCRLTRQITLNRVLSAFETGRVQSRHKKGGAYVEA